MKTVGHILKEISIHVYYLIKTETAFFVPAGEL